MQAWSKAMQRILKTSEPDSCSDLFFFFYFISGQLNYREQSGVNSPGCSQSHPLKVHFGDISPACNPFAAKKGLSEVMQVARMYRTVQKHPL